MPSCSIPGMPHTPVDPSKLPPWKRPSPTGKSRPLSATQLDAARERAAQAGRRYPNLVDNMWAARHVPHGDAAGTDGSEDE